MSTSLLDSKALSAIGQRRPLRTGLITAHDIRKYCIATDNRNPVYLDQNAARAKGFADIVAPPLFPAVATRPVPFEDELQPDGQYGDLAPEGLGHLQSLLAGQEWEFIRPALVGEQVVEDVRIGSITERQGKSGLLVFVVEESLLSTQDGEPILHGRNHLILRPHPSGAATPIKASPKPRQKEALTQWDGSSLIKRPSLVSLFMFGATIWATHRIHWDKDAARGEGLPAPILPGWMMASYLVEFAERLCPSGKRLSALSLRYQSFGYPDDELTCSQTDDHAPDTGIRLVNQAGQVLMAGAVKFA